MREIVIDGVTTLRKPVVIDEDTTIRILRFCTLSFGKNSSKSKKYGHFKILGEHSLIFVGENKNEANLNLWLFEEDGFSMVDSRNFRANIEFRNIGIICGPRIRGAIEYEIERLAAVEEIIK